MERNRRPVAIAALIALALSFAAPLPGFAMPPPRNFVPNTGAYNADGVWLRGCSLAVERHVPFDGSAAIEYALLLGEAADGSGRKFGVILGGRGGSWNEARTRVTVDQKPFDPFGPDAAALIDPEAVYRFSSLRALASVDAAALAFPADTVPEDLYRVAATLEHGCPAGTFVALGDFELVRDRALRVVAIAVRTADGSLPDIATNLPEGTELARVDGGYEARHRGPLCLTLEVSAPGYRVVRIPLELFRERVASVKADLGAYWSGDEPAVIEIAADPKSPTRNPELFFRGRALGKAPARIELRERVADAEILAAANGLESRSRFGVDGPGPVRVLVSLDAEERRASLDSKPSGAVVYLNGQAVGSTPLELAWFGPRASIRLHYDGKADWTADLKLPPGRAGRRVVTLVEERRGGGNFGSMGPAAYGYDDPGSGVRNVGVGFGVFARMSRDSYSPVVQMSASQTVGLCLDRSDGSAVGGSYDVQLNVGLSLFGGAPFDIHLDPLAVRYGLRVAPDFTGLISLGSGGGLDLTIGKLVVSANVHYHWLAFPSSGLVSASILACFRSM